MVAPKDLRAATEAITCLEVALEIPGPKGGRRRNMAKSIAVTIDTRVLDNVLRALIYIVSL
jgi:hypothetical protein